MSLHTRPVLILRTEHHSSLGIMRTLGRLGVRVYAVHSTKGTPASHSRYCAGMLTWDLDTSPAEESVQFLMRAAEKIGSRPLLMATNDETAIFISENASRLKAGFVFTENAPELLQSLYNKKEMYFLAKRLGIPTAETAFPASRAEVVEFCSTARFPIMLKASDNIVIKRRSELKMVIARSQQELLKHYDAMEDPSRPSLMLQEYIPGKDDCVWMFNGYFDENSECLFGITGRKIHQTPVYTGMTALGVCLPNPEVEATTKRLMKAVGYKGILDIGYRFDARDGSYKLLDVNPRLGATFRLFVGKDGMDVVRAQYRHMNGLPVEKSQIDSGRKWVVSDADLVSSLIYYKDGAIGAGEWIRSYSGLREDAWFASDDTAPFLHICGRLVARFCRKLIRRSVLAERSIVNSFSPPWFPQ